MSCSKCGRKAIVELRYMGKCFCSSCFLRFFEKRFRKNLRKIGIKKDEKIGVAVSGGKDSMTLLYLLKKFGYNIVTISINEGICGYREKCIKFVKEFCKKNEIDHFVFEFEKEYELTTDMIAKKEKNVCSFCGVLRRYLLNKKAKELGCKYLAIAHNLDDEVQSAVMNFIRGEHYRTLRMGDIVGEREFEEFVKKIKPLRYIPEKEIVIYSLLNKIPFYSGSCPYSKDAFRRSVGKFINYLEWKHPGTKYKILSSIENLKKIIKPQDKEAKRCKICGYPTNSEICKVCEILQNAKKYI